MGMIFIPNCWFSFYGVYYNIIKRGKQIKANNKIEFYWYLIDRNFHNVRECAIESDEKIMNYDSESIKISINMQKILVMEIEDVL